MEAADERAWRSVETKLVQLASPFAQDAPPAIPLGMDQERLKLSMAALL